MGVGEQGDGLEAPKQEDWWVELDGGLRDPSQPEDPTSL